MESVARAVRATTPPFRDVHHTIKSKVDELSHGAKSVMAHSSAEFQQLSNRIKQLSIGQYIKSRSSSTTFLQKLAAFYYCWSFMGWMWCWIATLLICFRIPVIFPLVVIYTLYIYGPGMAPAHDGRWTPRLRNWSIWPTVASYFKAHLHKTADLPPSEGPYIFGFHPHGVVAFGGFLSFGTHALAFNTKFPGIDVRVLTLNVNFQAPGLREYLLLHGTCSVDKSSCLRILKNGKSIMIVIGGGKESLYSKPRSADLVLHRRKGFIKIALQTGASLVPVYSFGETDTFRTLNELPQDALLRRAQRWLLKKTGFTVPLVSGTGFVLPWGLLPFPVPIDVVVGAPIKVEKYTGDVDSAEFRVLVDKYHGMYIEALRQLFDDNKEKYGKGDIEMRLVDEL